MADKLVPLQQVDPLRYKAWVESSQQPGASLQQTQAATAAEGASAAHTEQAMEIAKRQLMQQQFFTDTQKAFDANKKKNGYVDPNLYNATKQAAAGLGIDTGSFESSFGDKSGYIDPNKVINYNSAEGLANQQAYGQIKRQIQSQLDQYNSIPAGQKGLFSTAQLDQIPFLGQLLAPHAVAYEQNRSGLAAQLKGIAGAGQGSGVRANEAELGRWAGLIPSATDSQSVVHDKLQKLNDGIKATFNTPSGLDPQYLPSKGRPPLSTFGQ